MDGRMNQRRSAIVFGLAAATRRRRAPPRPKEGRAAFVFVVFAVAALLAHEYPAGALYYSRQVVVASAAVVAVLYLDFSGVVCTCTFIQALAPSHSVSMLMLMIVNVTTIATIAEPGGESQSDWRQQLPVVVLPMMPFCGWLLLVGFFDDGGGPPGLYCGSFLLATMKNDPNLQCIGGLFGRRYDSSSSSFFNSDGPPLAEDCRRLWWRCLLIHSSAAWLLRNAPNNTRSNGRNQVCQERDGNEASALPYRYIRTTASRLRSESVRDVRAASLPSHRARGILQLRSRQWSGWHAIALMLLPIRLRSQGPAATPATITPASSANAADPKTLLRLQPPYQ
jgi:hypothetical protein